MQYRQQIEDGSTTYKGRHLTTDEIERKRAIILATKLFKFGKEHSNLDYTEIYHFLVDWIADIEFPTMCLATARWIARQSEILYLDQIMLTRLVLRAHRKHYPIPPVVKLCCFCKKPMKEHTSYSMHKLCKRLDNAFRRLH
jgi:hypothetical protein